MPKIRFTSIAIVIDYSEESENGIYSEVKDSEILKSLGGLECDDEDSIFSHYLADGGDNTLTEAGVSGGTMWFEFSSEQGLLIGHTEYNLARTLTSLELQLLKEYTIDQWSDGIGSGFVQQKMREGLAPQILPINEESVLTQQFR